MNKLAAAFIIVLLLLSTFSALSQQPNSQPHFGLVVHGGAGTITKSSMTPEIEKQFRDTLTKAILTGYNILKNHGTSLDAVEAVIRILEDSPIFNAGKGAVFTHDGTNELDAAIMDGKTLKAGSVASLKHIKNPITLARMVMEKSPHVMLVGDGAEAFAKENGMALVPQSYFYTERRWKQLQEALAQEKQDTIKHHSSEDTSDGKHGTVGCVALDMDGDLAAGTSTGGTTNKRAGRVGDSPIIGAGTYANNATCAISASGTGEYFIRSVVGHDISALMEYKGLSLRQAADEVVMNKLVKMNGDGGVIAIDHNGNIAMPFNTPGFYRAYIDSAGNPVVKIYKE
jgi:beta-aspartyl-peptidase (threonine type)